MNLLIAVALALLVIHAGLKLLIQVKKDVLTPAYRYAAWCIVIGGFLIIALAGLLCIAKGFHYGAKMMKKGHAHHYYHGGDYDEEEGRSHKKWMKHGMMRGHEMQGNMMDMSACDMGCCPMKNTGCEMNNTGCGMNRAGCEMEMDNCTMMCKADSSMKKENKKK